MIKSKADLEKKKKLGRGILRELRKLHPDAKIALRYRNNMQLLAAVIMSAQCTDKKVNEVTEKLFKKYRTVADFADNNARNFAIAWGCQKNSQRRIGQRLRHC